MSGSLRNQLSFWLGAAVVLLALAAAAAAFCLAFDEANELQDELLRQIAGLFDAGHLPPGHATASDLSGYSDEAARIEIGVLGAIGERGEPWLPPQLDDGMHTLVLHGEGYRVYVRSLREGLRIAVAQETAVRDEIARESALLTLLPFVGLTPVLVALVTFILRRSFAPVKALSAEIERRSEQQLHAIDPREAPAEIRPFISAINRLLERVEKALAAERQFVAHAAHELRSPLAAVFLQAERLGNSTMSAEASERLATLRQGIERVRALVEQLLALAKAQSTAPATSGPIPLEPVLRQVLEELMPLAIAKELELEVQGDTSLAALATGADLATLLRNLVDNAIRYAPPGGRVEIRVSATHDCVQLDVEDSGPGIVPQERERVFEAFYRVPGNAAAGSGLGLSIAHTLVARLGGRIELGERGNGRGGLRVTVRLRKAALPESRESVAPHRNRPDRAS